MFRLNCLNCKDIVRYQWPWIEIDQLQYFTISWYVSRLRGLKQTKLLTHDSTSMWFSEPCSNINNKIIRTLTSCTFSDKFLPSRGEKGFVTNGVRIVRFVSEPSTCDTLCYFYINKNLVLFFSVWPSNHPISCILNGLSPSRPDLEIFGQAVYNDLALHLDWTRFFEEEYLKEETKRKSKRLNLYVTTSYDTVVHSSLLKELKVHEFRLELASKWGPSKFDGDSDDGVLFKVFPLQWVSRICEWNKY